MGHGSRGRYYMSNPCIRQGVAGLGGTIWFELMVDVYNSFGADKIASRYGSWVPLHATWYITPVHMSKRQQDRPCN